MCAAGRRQAQKKSENQHLTCEIEETSPSMSVIGRESKEAEMKWIALIRTRYPRREEKKQEAGVMKEIALCPNSFTIREI
ncbi:hypothetical protein CEXT_692811 [Caerostris extrusa]|uniref:Uncharacterized protein n=1 Tax=Caerostris extrusa TaxID=172846 RepID=A0AAV4NX59_CAEEX|nr:hypothetical protein CEXT_692811 [Caerostris extrusa]